MKNKNLGGVGVCNNMHIYMMPSKICVMLTNKITAIQKLVNFAFSTTNMCQEGEKKRERNL